MTFFKFLFVLALAVPLAVFMWNYINKLSDEFQKSVSRSRGSRRPEQPAGTERSPRPARSAGPGRSDRPDTAEASAGKMQKPASKRKRRKARKKDRELRNRETRK